MLVRSLLMVSTLVLSSCGTKEKASVKNKNAQKIFVVDGDTIAISGQQYRFDGVDTPEIGAKCGNVDVAQKATDAMKSYIKGRKVECETTGAKHEKRLIATCFAKLSNGKRINLSHQIVSGGWGRDWTKISKGRYLDAENKARAEKKGLWGLDCPSDLWGNRVYK